MQLFQIKRVDILSVLQFLNMVVWIFDVHVRINEKRSELIKLKFLKYETYTFKFFFQYKFIPVYLLPALMIYVGLLGGASYVNIFYLLLHEDKYPEEDREFCINITSLFITGGKQFCSYFYYQVQSLSLSYLIHCFVCSLKITICL